LHNPIENDTLKIDMVTSDLTQEVIEVEGEKTKNDNHFAKSLRTPSRSHPERLIATIPDEYSLT